MPIIATTSPQRLREIIDRLAGLKTFAQIADYKDTLTHDEREDYEAWTQGLKGAVKPAPRSKAKSKPKTTLPATSIDWTPQKQLEKEKGMTFAQWADERATLTEDQIFDIEAVTQGLKRSKKGQLRAEYLADLRVLKQEGPEALGALEKMGWTPQKQLDKEKGMTFAQWGEERATLTEDQIFAIEAYTQGLEAIEEEEEEGLSEEEISELKKLEEEEGERLTPGLEEE